MIGEGIRAVNEGMNNFVQTLRRDPRCLESVWISIITFSSQAAQVMPLSELTDVNVPHLKVSPGTALGSAFQLLKSCIQREVTQAARERKGDWRPLVFVITDGQPTDDFQISLNAMNDLTNPRVANIYAIGCGEDVDFGQIGEISDIVLKLDSLESEVIQKLFVWLTASVQTASLEVERAGKDQNGIDLCKLPKEVVKLDKGVSRRIDIRPRQVFVKAKCSVRGRPYLMRYNLVQEMGYYQPMKSHKLDPEDYDDQAGSFELPPISSDLLAGPASCPHCGQTGAGACGCGQVFCVSEPAPESVECPECRRILQASGQSRAFDMRQSEG